MRMLKCLVGILCFFSVQAENQTKPIERSLSLSVASTAALLQVERFFVKNAKEHIQALQKKVNILSSVIQGISEAHMKSNGTAENFLSNPINSFALIRRTQVEQPKLLEFLKERTDIHFMEATNEARSFLPTDTDLWEATEGMSRIQNVYELSPNDIAVGRFNGKDYETRLSTLELFTIGFELFKLKKFSDASTWLNATLNVEFFERPYERLANFDTSLAKKLYVESLIKDNRSTDALKALQNAKQLYSTEDYQQKENLIKQLPEHNSAEEDMDPNYIRLCRQNFEPRLTNLHCRYNATLDPYYLLAPFKMEELSMDPYIVLYYDVLTDTEIEDLKNKSILRMQRAKLSDENAVVVNNHRTVKNAWLELDQYLNIEQRTESIINLHHAGFEKLSVMNYGIAGHYNAHYDFFYPNIDEHSEQHGDRMATALFYLSDVEQGGATAFGLLNLTVVPQKGALLLWHNYHNSGDAHNLTLHGACPMIVGSKWVATFWIHEFAQFRRRPCYNRAVNSAIITN